VDDALGARLSRGIAGELIGVELGAPQVFVSGAVEPVRPGFDRDVDDAAPRPADLCVVNVGGDTELLGGLFGRHVGDVASAGVGVIRNAIDLVLVDPGDAPANGKIGDCAVIGGSGIEQAARVVDARGEIHQ